MKKTMEEEIVKKAAFKDIIIQVMRNNNKNLSPDEQHDLLYSFCDAVLNENPYVNNSQENCLFLIGQTAKDDIYASTDKLSKVITISEDFLKKTIIDQTIPLTEAFYVLGHERRHVAQLNTLKAISTKQYKKLSDEQKEKLSKMVHDLNEHEISNESIHFVFNILESQLGEKYDEFANLSKDEKKTICNKFALDQYFKFEHEKDARQTGYIFAKYMVESLVSEPNFDSTIKRELSEQIKSIDDLEKTDTELYKEENETINTINTAIQNISIEELSQNVRNLDNQIFTMTKTKALDKQFGSASSLLFENYHRNCLASFQTAVEYISSQQAKNLPIKDHSNLLYTSMTTGYTMGFDSLVEQFKVRPDNNDKIKKDVGKNISQILVNSDLPVETYEYDYLSIIDANTLTNTITELTKNNKLVPALLLLSTTKRTLDKHIYEEKYNISTNDIQKISKASAKLAYIAKEQFNALLNSEKISLQEIEMLYRPMTILDKESDFLTAFDLRKNKIKMSSEEEFEYLTNKYGQKFIQSVKAKPDLYEIHSAFMKEDEKQQANTEFNDNQLLG